MTSPLVVTPRPKLSPKLREILAFVERYIGLRGSSPTLHDLVDNCNLRSTDTARAHCQALARKGWITFDATVEQGIALVEGQS